MFKYFRFVFNSKQTVKNNIKNTLVVYVIIKILAIINTESTYREIKSKQKFPMFIQSFNKYPETKS